MKKTLTWAIVLSLGLFWGCQRPTPPTPSPTASVVPENTPSASPVAVKKSIDTWALQLQEININNLAKQELDLLVIEPFPNGESQPGLSPADLMRLKESGTKVLSYLSLGEAEDYRSYWQESWHENPPQWLGKENPDWKGNFKVEYWSPEWQELMHKAMKARVDAGYDGVYLDLVDAYEPFEEQGRNEARQEMIDFVVKLAQSARKTNSAFQIYAQNGEALTSDKLYLETIDGVGREELFYGYEGKDNEQTPAAQTEAMLKDLARIKKAGKVVLTVEYTDRPEQMKKATESIRSAGFVPYFAPRGLDDVPQQGA